MPFLFSILLAAPALAAPGLGSATADPVAIASGKGVLAVEIQLPDGRKLSEEAPSAWHAVGADGVGVTVDGQQDLKALTVDVPLEVASDGHVELELSVYHCTVSDCKNARHHVVVPVKLAEAGEKGTVVVRVE